jgi:hypothetical protein
MIGLASGEKNTNAPICCQPHMISLVELDHEWKGAPNRVKRWNRTRKSRWLVKELIQSYNIQYRGGVSSDMWKCSLDTRPPFQLSLPVFAPNAHNA